MRILSVRLSVKRVHCNKAEERSVQIFMRYKRSFSLVFSERELMFMFAICRRPSVCLSVCLSVVCLSVTFVHPTQPIKIFSNVSAPFNMLVI